MDDFGFQRDIGGKGDSGTSSGHRRPSENRFGGGRGLRVSHHDTEPENQKTWNAGHGRQGGFYNTALRVLYTLTPAILILDSHRRVVFANRQAEELLVRGDVISVDCKGQIYCTDRIAQNFLLQYLMSQKNPGDCLFDQDEGSFLIPKADGWPMVAMVGCDQLDSLAFNDCGLDADRHVTLVIRDPEGRHPGQSRKLMEYFGLSGAESSVVGELVKGRSTDQIARKRGVSVVTIRNQLKSAQNKIGVARQSELVSLVLRYIS